MIGNPLDFIESVHREEREVCAVLDRIVVGSSTAHHDAHDVVAFLRTELPLHLEDEEEDFFPLLRARCEPEDEIEKVILRLRSDHEHAADDTPEVIAILEDMPSSGLSQLERQQLAAYASHARRHLTAENAIILPIARARLTDNDLADMRAAMLKRRGLGAEQERSHA